ncbi:MAG TPA: EscU/YscU/HrcU family type III secretion system export apparatus switch protein [Candidatus Baltobacteraceae bacterium]
MKSFEPTPSRLERARREGDHPVSRDAVSVASFCGALLGFSAVLPVVRAGFLEGMHAIANPGDLARIMRAGFIAVAATGAGSALAAALATVAQTRGISMRPLPFRLNISPPLGIEAAHGVARSTLSALACLVVIACAIKPVPSAIGRAIEGVVAVGIVAAIVDVLVVRKGWRRRLRMTFDELRREMRENDGDPQARARRRRLHRLVIRGALRNVRRATFVVVNPTHIAIALRYVTGEMPVPMILVRAAGDGALRVRKLAAELRIPLIEDPPLARRLFAHDALGPIPPEVYLAVAQIIAALQREE